MENILVSACLLGENCRYDGKAGKRIDIESLRKKYNLIPVCPEVLGGLPTPRTPSERVGERVVMKDGRDVTDNFMKGAREALKICEAFGCKRAILKERSPSCGSGEIYDGTFSKSLTAGDGMTAALLKENGIRVIGESQIAEFLKECTVDEEL